MGKVWVVQADFSFRRSLFQTCSFRPPGRVLADIEGEKIVISKTEEENK